MSQKYQSKIWGQIVRIKKIVKKVTKEMCVKNMRAKNGAVKYWGSTKCERKKCEIKKSETKLR